MDDQLQRSEQPGPNLAALLHRGRSESAGPTDLAIEVDEKQ